MLSLTMQDPSMGPRAMTASVDPQRGGPGAPCMLGFLSTCSVSWVRPWSRTSLLWLDRLLAKGAAHRCSVTVQSVGAVGLRWSEHRLCYTHQVQRSSSQTQVQTLQPLQLWPPCAPPSFLNTRPFDSLATVAHPLPHHQPAGPTKVRSSAQAGQLHRDAFA